MKYTEIPDSGEPTDIIQNHQMVRLEVNSCRYVWLKHWKHKCFTFPFWRLYWNKNNGAFIIHTNKVMVSPDQLILIPPNTPFSTDLTGDNTVLKTESLTEGGFITSQSDEYKIMHDGHILHLYIHFNLGSLYDLVKPEIYTVNVTPEIHSNILEIIGILKLRNEDFSFKESLVINSLVISALSSLPGRIWLNESVRFPILQIINCIQRNIAKKLTNKYLSSLINMSPNAFARLFREQVGISPHDYVLNARIENVCNLFYNSTLSIDKIASESGFADRYYFSKVFNSKMHTTPARFRKDILRKKRREIMPSNMN